MEDHQSTGEQPVELTLADALAQAIALHRGSEIDNAETLYRRILTTFPDNPDALHFLGLLERQRGRFDEALELMRQAVAIEPEYASAHNNIGNLLIERGDLDGALASLEMARAMQPDNVLVLNNLGIVWRGKGDLQAAQGFFARAVEIEPKFALPYENLGNYHYVRGEVAQAHDYFCRAIVIDPTLVNSNTYFGMALMHLGRHDEAREFYEQWGAREPENPVPKHMISTIAGQKVPSRASDDYVRVVFDTFAASFDSQLARLKYRAPELMTEALRRTGRESGLRVLDAGCGTGLCGKLLRPAASRLEGVDLSPRMLDGARRTGMYDELVEGELTAQLEARLGAFDVVISADTLCYFGDIERVARAAHGALVPGGHFIFSVEAASGADAADFIIGTSGRYAHARGYLESTLRRAGFAGQHVAEEDLRMESGTPVRGYVVTATRN